MTKAILIPALGDIRIVEVSNGDEIREKIGGWMEGLRVSNDLFAYIDEEGKLKNKPLNTRATDFCVEMKTGLRPDDFIVGDMLLFGKPDQEGDETDVPQKYIEQLI